MKSVCRGDDKALDVVISAYLVEVCAGGIGQHDRTCASLTRCRQITSR